MESPKKLLPVNASEIIDQVKSTILLSILTVICSFFIRSKTFLDDGRCVLIKYQRTDWATRELKIFVLN